MSRNLRGLSERYGLKQSLFGEIVKAGSAPPGERDELLAGVSEKYLTGKSSTLGASSFYDFLKPEHRGKKVFVCDGTACLTSGRGETLRESLLNVFSNDEIGRVTCLGHCHSNNAFLYKNSTYSSIDLNSGGEPLNSNPPVKTHVNTGSNTDKPALFSPTGDLREYYGILTEYAGKPERALIEIEKSGLRGRGGAGFPFYLKLKESVVPESAQKYVVCNADEGDPGAFSDKWLLEERPHSVLSGMMLTGMITGADTGILYIRGEYPESVKTIRTAILELEKLSLAGENILNTGFNFNFHVVEGVGAYICGEETSLLNSIEGLRPEVRTRPPFPAVSGLFGKPTVLSNVETFANIPLILKKGGITFSLTGTEKSSGTKLVSLDSAFRNPGLFEVKMGTPLWVIVNDLGGGTRFPVKALQIGGPLGGIVPRTKISDLTLDFESFSRDGFLLGHSGIVSIPEDFPMITYLMHLFEFTLKESCGKCFPCRIGSERGYELFKNSIEKGEKIDRELMEDLLDTMQFGSLCALGGGLPLPVRNALQYFNRELEQYFKSGAE